ncbi:hypothetical protein ACM66B_004222 [Microbotryomycetes sp. NB124-2]
MFRHLEQQHSLPFPPSASEQQTALQQYTPTGMTEPSSSHAFGVWDQHPSAQQQMHEQQQRHTRQPLSTESRSDDGNGSSSPKPQRKTTTSRSAMACVLCRKQKMKCEGKDKAPCKRCRAAKVECTFEPSPAGSTLPRSRGVSKEWIEDRMASVEGRLVKLESRRGSLDSENSSASPGTTSPTTPTSSTAALEARIAQLEAQVFALTFAASGGGQRPGVGALMQGNSTPTVLPPHSGLYTSQSHYGYGLPAQPPTDNNGYASQQQQQPPPPPPAHHDGSAAAFAQFYPTPNLDLPSPATELYYQHHVSAHQNSPMAYGRPQQQQPQHHDSASAGGLHQQVAYGGAGANSTNGRDPSG